MEDYNKNIKKFSSLQVVNDVAERAVQLVDQFNNVLTKDKEEEQYILQVVSEYKRMYPDCTKTNLAK